jgi:putative ABC transport system permease protein
MQTLWQDLRYGVRMLVKNPGFTLVAVVTLALGIGTNAAVYSIVDSLLLRPLPVAQPQQITVLAYQQRGGQLQTQFSYLEVQDVRSQASEAFSDLAGCQQGQEGLTANGQTQPILVNYVTGSFFSMLGIKPALGRFIMPDEGNAAGADPVIVLGYSYWKTRLGGDPRVVGQTVSINGYPVTIIGVAPKGFRGVLPLLDVQGYLPAGMVTEPSLALGILPSQPCQCESGRSADLRKCPEPVGGRVFVRLLPSSTSCHADRPNRDIATQIGLSYGGRVVPD